MYVFESERYRQSCAGRTFNADILKVRLEDPDREMSTRSQFKPVAPPYLVKRDEKNRVVAREASVDGEPVFCLLELFPRKDSAYDHFRNDPRKYAAQHYEPELANLSAWLRERKRDDLEHNELSRTRPLLRMALQPWLTAPHDIAGIDPGDQMIYEGPRWVQSMRRQQYLDFWQTYRSLIEEAAALRPGCRPVLPDYPYALLVSKGRCRLLAVSREIGAGVGAGANVLYLVRPFESEPDHDQIRRELEGMKRLTSDPRPLGLDDIASWSTKTYPYYLLADDSIWLAVERGEANLALSSEEDRLLAGLSDPVGRNSSSSLPIFINGRAGSGKSTMLMYLFAAYCYRKLAREQEIEGQPVYLTYNERLLDKARQGVQDLLTSHHRYLSRVDADPPVVEPSWFQPFQRFLLGRLAETERERFSPDRRIGFHEFKSGYLNDSPRMTPLLLPEARRWSAETSWYVLRTFIKGHSGSGILHPDDYVDAVPRRDRVVDTDTYRAIFSSIWEKWYRSLTTEQGYWDDQDLARAALSEGALADPYMAIFCDEAQDFTRLELELLVQSSIYSRVRLAAHEAPAIPFAFAGDPLQTLNPTGFRWESVKTAFHEEVLRPLGLEHRDMARGELKNNYRSSLPIVAFLNLIQGWRQRLFLIKDLTPQIAWRKDQSAAPAKYILGQNLDPDRLATFAEDTIILVPCEEGQEVAYVQGDDILSAMYPDANEGTPPKNVMSATLAKGLEFSKIILYKFGQACPPTLWGLVDSPDDLALDAQYFFNKLYVAASRATEALFIVDTEDGDDLLWRRAERSDSELFAATLPEDCADARWSELVGGLEVAAGGSEGLLRNTDPETTARELKTVGIDGERSSLLRRAARYFHDLGLYEEATLCEAHALRFEGVTLRAGELFLSLGEFENAWLCFWKSAEWGALSEWFARAGTDAVRKHQDDRALVDFMADRGSDVLTLRAMSAALAARLDTDEALTSMSSQYRSIVFEFARRAITVPASAGDTEFWHECGEVLRRLAQGTGGRRLRPAGAECFYRAGSWFDAVDMWKASGDTDSPAFAVAMAHLESGHRIVEWYLRAGLPDEAIAAWHDAGEPAEPAWVDAVRPALVERRQFSVAFELCVRAGLVEEARTSLDAALESNAVDKPGTAVLVLGGLMLRQRRFVEVLDLLDAHRRTLDGETLDQAQTDLVLALANAPERVPDRDQGQSQSRLLDFVLQIADRRAARGLGLDPRILGAALERTGRVVETLRFYERHWAAVDQGLRRFARERWLVVKKRQFDTVSALDSRRDRYRVERAAKAHEWGYSENAALPDLPFIEPAPAEVPALRADRPAAPATTTRHVADLDILDKRQRGAVHLVFSPLGSFVTIDLTARTVTAAEPWTEIHPGVWELCYDCDRYHFRVDLDHAPQSIEISLNHEIVEIIRI